MNPPNLPTQHSESSGADASLRLVLDAIRDQNRMLITIAAHLAKLVTLTEKRSEN